MFNTSPILFLAVLFVSILFFGIIGQGLSSFLSGKLLKQKALLVFHGLLFSVGVFSATVTGFHTIQVLIFAYFILQMEGFSAVNHRIPKADLKLAAHHILVSFLFAIPSFLLFYFFIFRAEDSVTLPFMDEVFYSKVASSLISSKVETNDLYCIWFKENCLSSPYHYFEIWLTGLVSFCTGISTLLTYKLIAIPLIFGITGAVLYDLARQTGVGIAGSVTSVYLVFTAGMFFGYQTMIDWPLSQTLKVQLHFISDFVPLNRVKLATVSLFFSVFVYLNKGGIKLSWLPLLLCGGLWLTAAPSVWSLAFIVMILEKDSRNHFLRFCLFIAFAFLAIFLLYYFGREKLSFEDSIIFLKYKSLRIIAGTILYELGSHLVILFPALILGLFVWDKIRIRLIFLVLISIVPGIIFHSLTIGAVDSFQFVSNISPVSIAVLFFLVSLELFKSVIRFRIALISLFVLVQSFFTYKTLAYSYQNYSFSVSRVFLNELETSREGGQVRVISLSEGKGGFSDMPRTNYTGSWLLFVYPGATFLQVNAEEILASLKGSFKEGLKSNPFFRYVDSRGIGNFPEARIALLKEFMPQFLVVSGEVDLRKYKELLPYISKPLEDRLSGEKIYELRYGDKIK
jgi:hypothetical protein